MGGLDNLNFMVLWVGELIHAVNFTVGAVVHADLLSYDMGLEAVGQTANILCDFFQHIGATGGIGSIL